MPNSSTDIIVHNLGKKYRIGLKEEKSETLAGALFKAFKQPTKNFKRLRGMTKFQSREEDDVVWALKDINFEVKRGEVIGIVGHNGAGKSTLLKIMSRVTAPTQGSIKISGRISALLEVGTGFHPELTGRENIYLNGTILGMTKREVDAKLDDIIDFSGIHKYIDTPVKFYSSGMRVRLGFSVAAYLEPEILIIDEVLAVGDVEFQKKCLGKIQNVSHEGRTVLFVSHNMNAVRTLCERGILLNKGRIVKDAKIDEVVSAYVMNNQSGSSSIEEKMSVIDASRRWGSLHMKIEKVAVMDSKGFYSDKLLFREPFSVNIKGEVSEPVENALVQIRICKDDETQVVYSSTNDENYMGLSFMKGAFEISANFDCDLLPGNYNLIIFICNQAAAIMYDTVHHVFSFEVDTVADNGTNWNFVGVPCAVNSESKWSFSQNLTYKPIEF